MISIDLYYSLPLISSFHMSNECNMELSSDSTNLLTDSTDLLTDSTDLKYLLADSTDLINDSTDLLIDSLNVPHNQIIKFMY